MTATGASIELEAGLEGAPPVAPTFAPVGQERPITTRAAAASAVDRRQRVMQEVGQLRLHRTCRMHACWCRGAAVPAEAPAAQFWCWQACAESCGSRKKGQRTGCDPGWCTVLQVTVQYNLCNEPWVKYAMAGVADRGLAPSLWTSARMHHSVLYLETHRCGLTA